MRRLRIRIATGVCLAAGLTGCDFLNDPKAESDPNAPTLASTNQLFVGTVANVIGQQEGPVAMTICMWMQQCAGSGGRFVEEYSTYNVTQSSFDADFASMYRAGGLTQIRDVERRADEAGDKVYKGMAEVVEAMDILWGADIWGDIPYREAADPSITTPHFDPQQQIYDDLLKLLDQAITDLGGAGSGPGAYDLVYGGSKAAWVQLANTIKARIHLHRVEKLGNAEYTAALQAAQQGIGSPANDFNAKHSGATSERNLWAQFQLTSFGNDLVAGRSLVDIMKADNDPRLPEYFGQNDQGGLVGYDPPTQTPSAHISSIATSGRASDPTFPQPLVTYDENQLIIAEAQLQLGNVAAAATALNNVRARHSKGLIAVPTLADIMREKYITTFQNVEAWNDYKRTCLPTLQPALGRQRIPGRFPYGLTEAQTNPNTPAEGNFYTFRNWNDPNACQ